MTLPRTAPTAPAVALTAGLVGGALTQVGQGALPAELGPLANSAAAAWLATSAGSAAGCGLVGLAALEVGYVVAARAVGHPDHGVLADRLRAVVGVLLLGLAARRTHSAWVLAGYAAGVLLLLATRVPSWALGG